MKENITIEEVLKLMRGLTLEQYLDIIVAAKFWRLSQNISGR